MVDSAARFRRIGQLFHAALELGDNAAREVMLRAECGNDAELLAEVRSLLDARDQEQQANQSAAVHQPGPRRFGPYETIRLLGRGGMGAVFLARRADEQFEHEVAVKTVNSAFRSEFFESRFRSERQILASLQHPNITRLLDGGVDEEGLPYLVMEYVEGEHLDRYCDSRRLPIAARIRLFLGICRAVSFAHRNLVVHRDLKPSNILVDRSGRPHLLDFGTAKLLPSSDDLTRGGLLPMTPRYASPEMLRNRTATPAADQFSLGVVLYELLTGSWPFGDADTPLNSLERVVRDVDPSAPTTRVSEEAAERRSTNSRSLKKTLQGDLSTIVLKTLEEDPLRRYATVDDLASDLQRYLDGRPVLARPQTIPYRTQKFVRRHWLGVAAASLIVIAGAAGLGATLREKRVAEQRFQDVRSIAHYVLSDLDDRMAQLPGSTSVRADMAARSMQYLDALRAQAGSDVGLRMELAEGYLRLGNVLGNLFRSNLGKPQEARAAYQRASELADQLARERPGDEAVRRLVARVSFGRGLMESFASSGSGDVENVQHSLEQFESLLRSGSASASDEFELGRAYLYLEVLRMQRGGLTISPAKHSAGMDRAEEHLQRAVNLSPVSGEYRLTLADLHERKAIAFGTQDPAASLAEYERAAATFAQLPALYKAGFPARFWEANLHLNHAWPLGQVQRYAEAFEQLRLAQPLLEQLAEMDPANVRIRYQLTALHRSWGIVANYAGKKAEAIEHFLKGVQVYDSLPELTDPLRFLRSELLLRSASISTELGKHEQAAKYAGEAAVTLRRLADQPDAPASWLYSAAQLLSGEVAKNLRDPEAAVRYAERAVAKTPTDVAAIETLATAYFLSGRRDQAIATLEKALTLATAPGRSRTGLLEKLRQYRGR